MCLAKKFVKQYFLLNSFMKLGPGNQLFLEEVVAVERADWYILIWVFREFDCFGFDLTSAPLIIPFFRRGSDSGKS